MPCLDSFVMYAVVSPKMLPRHASALRLGHTLLIALALAANLIATGVPVMHALAHDRDHAQVHRQHREPHPHTPSSGGHNQDHEEIHPAVLHDDWLVLPSIGLDNWFLISVMPYHGPANVETKMAPPRDAPVILARAPPSVTLPRAPPFA